MARWAMAGVAIAIVVAVAIALPMILVIGRSGLAFAEVQAAAAAYKSYKYRYLDFHGAGDPYVTSVTAVRGVGSRSEASNGSEAITNLKARRTLRLDHRARKAIVQQLYLDDG